VLTLIIIIIIIEGGLTTRMDLLEANLTPSIRSGAIGVP
jgi:NhaP-type Na+/H+ and K+/H+ antiporter